MTDTGTIKPFITTAAGRFLEATTVAGGVLLFNRWEPLLRLLLVSLSFVKAPCRKGSGRHQACSPTPRAMQIRLCRARRLKPFAFQEVDDAFARKEGDHSLEWWREVHMTYFKRNGGFFLSMLLWCEEFEVVMEIPLGN